MNIQMIRKKIEMKGKVQENFKLVDTEVLRLNRLLNDLLGFARPRPLKLKTTDLVEVVDRVCRLMAERLAAEGIRLETDLPPRLEALCDAEQMEQILLNLVLNAIEAMETIDGERTITIRVRAINGSVEIRVGDTGPGIADADREKLFDPFFTTKTTGGGLGLSTVQSIVMHHHGSVDAHNRENGGAEFTVRLPIRHEMHAAGRNA
jgi:two-component system C4-dicarboxylate transport sensor histidine kinase DctB